MENKPIFTVDWEDWFSSIYPFSQYVDKRIEDPTYFILYLLKSNGVKAVFYVLESTYKTHVDLYDRILESGHVIGYHGFEHVPEAISKPFVPFRSPNWSTTPMPWPPSGGVFFRALPLPYLKWAVRKSGVFWIHPYDIDEGHPWIKDPVRNFKRHIGLKDSRKKLETLVSSISWGDPDG